MYVTTFYSFKGGVGRTMALVNSAVELANWGRRVLIVDFDLEAPGLDTFDALGFQRDVPGVIDFVTEYMVSGQAPKIEAFIEKSASIGTDGGGLWIMPAGASRTTYGEHFRQIDWSLLYEEHNGYLLFEDLKEQWKEAIDPDYVLIDSRTGHTDVGGICTRQLPDAVAIFFFPNEQNLRGLTKIVQDIRSEGESPRQKEVELHFIMSNVPDLDDEDSILQRKIDAFQAELDFKRKPMIVHRYDSLSLLNQVVFTKERPRSRLAEEYKGVVQEIVRRNWADREGALDYIRKAGGRWRRDAVEELSPWELVKNLEEIDNIHLDDGEVLFHLGALRQEEGQLESAVSLFNRAIDAGYVEPEVWLRRGRAKRLAGDEAGGSKDALRALRTDGLQLHYIRQAMLLTTSDDTDDMVKSTAVNSLGVQESIRFAESTLVASSEKINAAVPILISVLDDEDLTDKDRGNAIKTLGLLYISSGRFAEAAELLGGEGETLDDLDVADAFNYGMARWGVKGNVDAMPFKRVVELDRADTGLERKGDANYFQCMAVAYWAVGELDAGIEFAQQASASVDSRRPVFSCWRYRRVSAKVFREDVDRIISLINGDSAQVPSFMAENAATG